ncbi:hypothetical protein SH2C18_37670 [Clostridium sediminicola]|uniref:hypothetical protein n=1 Tax=Clostridium sediminicola TaxID=3114879 RepID=UPI0031F27436
MESIIDHTDVKQAAKVAEKQAKYQKVEVNKLLEDIENLAEGKLIYLLKYLMVI